MKRIISIFVVLTVISSFMFAKEDISAEPICKDDIKKVTASSVYSEATENIPENAFDGDEETRWESEWKTDPSWISIELKDKTKIETLEIIWEYASGKVYCIQSSDNEKKWNTIRKIEDGKSGEHRKINFDDPVVTKYLRIFGEERTLDKYGYSIFEISINPVDISKAEKVEVIKAEASTSQVEEGRDFSPELAVDADTETRWSSEFEDPQWIMFELKDKTKIKAVKIKWEQACAKTYNVQVSTNKKIWNTVASIKDAPIAEERTISFKPVKTKYVRIFGKERNGEWGYSIWEVEILK